MKKNLFILFLFIVLAGLLAFGKIAYTAHADEINYVRSQLIESKNAQEKADKTYAEKVESVKNGILDQLSVGCETNGVKEPDSAILLDTNNKMSIGAFQFQITTVQHYIKKFEHRDITRVEAIQIAIGSTTARDLASHIIFEEKGGLESNWTNCAKRLDLPAQVSVVNKL